jgi:4-amino-4-deoxy-L-arabinose transferase-like glycosyltransferase
LAHWAYVDLGNTYYSTASLLCIARWIESREEKKWLALAGLSAGFTMATKPNGLLAALVLGLLAAFALAKQKERPLREGAFSLLLFGLLALIPYSPWAIKNLIWTGNPFFPLLGNLFPASSGIDSGEGGGLTILDRRQLLYGENGWQIAALPLRLFFSGQDDIPQYFDGILNPMLILFLPWAFQGKWVEEKKRFFAFSLLYLLYALFLVEMRVRYILPLVPPLVILLVYGIHNIYLRISHPAWLVASITLLWLWNGIYLWNHVGMVSPWNYLLRHEGREAYLSRMLSDYPGIQYINQTLPPTVKIYFLFTGRRVYYCERDYFHDTGENPWLLARAIQAAQDAKDLRLKLQKIGATHLFVREDLLQRFLKDNLAPERLQLWTLFTQQHLQGLFHARGYSLYQIHG